MSHVLGGSCRLFVCVFYYSFNESFRTHSIIKRNERVLRDQERIRGEATWLYNS